MTASEQLHTVPDATLRAAARNRDAIIADTTCALRDVPRDGQLAEALERVRARAVAQRELILGELSKRGKRA